MSDKRVSETGKQVSEDSMSISALEEAATWAEQLMDAEWRGRRDKENLVRYRLSRKVGVSESYLFRLQYKRREMNDVKGSVYRALMIARKAYEGLCERVENAADTMERELWEIEEHDEANQRSAPPGASMAGASKASRQEMR